MGGSYNISIFDVSNILDILCSPDDSLYTTENSPQFNNILSPRSNTGFNPFKLYSCEHFCRNSRAIFFLARGRSGKISSF